MGTTNDQFSLRIRKSDQGLYCPFTELLFFSVAKKKKKKNNNKKKKNK